MNQTIVEATELIRALCQLFTKNPENCGALEAFCTKLYVYMQMYVLKKHFPYFHEINDLWIKTVESLQTQRPVTLKFLVSIQLKEVETLET